uniref:Uncharacterized protein n=1 Tax=Oryza brachyantha TaxID=4533 RepID=J3M6S3_ORYBR
MAQANTAQRAPEENAKFLARWREKLRAPGRGLPPADYSYIKLEDVCDERATPLLSRLRELGASPPTCVYFGDITGAEANISLGRLFLRGGALGRHIVESFTDDELDQVIDDRLEVPVFDDEGRRYDFRCGYLDYSGAAGAYQLVGAGDDYKLLMKNNSMVRGVSQVGKGVSLLVFAFRSELLVQESHAASGALCMLMLFFAVL